VNRIGRLIEQHRTERGQSRLEVAGILKVTQQTVGNWERGHSRPQLATLPDIARLLGRPVEELVALATQETT